MEQSTPDVVVDWQVQCVFDNATGIRFAYTIGLTEHGLPELIVVGRTHPMTLGSMLNHVALGWVRTAAPVLGAVDVGLDLRDGGDLRAAAREVTDTTLVKTQYAIQAVNRYQDDLRPLRFVQVTYADNHNVLPGEPGYSTDPIYEQPLL